MTLASPAFCSAPFPASPTRIWEAITPIRILLMSTLVLAVVKPMVVVYLVATILLLALIAEVYFLAACVWPYRNSDLPGDLPWTIGGSLFQLGILPSLGLPHLLGIESSFGPFSPSTGVNQTSGNCYLFYGGRTLCEGLDVAHRKYGDVYAVWLGFDRVVMFNTPKAAKYVYAQPRTKYDQAEYLRDRQKGIAAQSLSTSVGEIHRRHVKALGPMLKRFKLLPMIPKMHTKVVQLLSKWHRLHNDTSVRSCPYTPGVSFDLKALMLDVFGSLAFDHDLGVVEFDFTDIDQQDLRYSDLNRYLPPLSLAGAILTVINRVAAKFMMAVPGKLALVMEKVDVPLMQARKIIREYLVRAIEKARTKLQAADIREMVTPGTAVPQPEDNSAPDAPHADDIGVDPTIIHSHGDVAACSNLLELLLSTIEGESPLLSVEELFDDLTLFLFAGTDSSASMLGFAIYFLSKDAELQQEVKEEVWSVLGKPQPDLVHELTVSSQAPWTMNAAPTPDELARLPLLEAVVKETLRMSSTSLGASRQVFIDDVVDGHTLRKGDNLMVNAVQIQHDDRFYPDAKQFRPHRWIDIDATTPNDPLSSPPPVPILHTFGGGHRSCVGRELAQMELKLFLATMLRYCTFVDTPGNTNEFTPTKADRCKFSIAMAVPDVRHMQVKLQFDSA